MVCVHARWEESSARTKSLISFIPASLASLLMSLAFLGPVILASHVPDHSAALLGIRYSGPISNRPAEDGFLLPFAVHSDSLGLMKRDL